MRSQLVVRRILSAPARYAIGLALAAALGVTACSSSSTPAAGSGSTGSATSAAPSSPAPSSPAASSMAAEPTSGSAAEAAIKANWESFFSGKTSAATKLALVQNGQKYATVINNQEGSPQSQSATSTVTSVTITSPTSATVKYNVGISGASLNGQTGTAVYEDGVWKVADVSFCQLLTLQNLGQTPPVCK